MFITNKYYKWYYNIIENRKIFSYDGYTEKHHIIPKSLVPPNELDNLVKLSAREHFICHLLLAKITEGKEKAKMIWALHSMTYRKIDKQKRDFKISSKIYQIIREEFSMMIKKSKTGIPRSPEFCAKMSIIAKNRVWSDENKAQMSISRKGLNTWSKDRKLSPEHIANIAKASTGRIQSQEHIDKRVKSHLGAKRSAEIKANISASLMGKTKGISKPKVICPHCLKEGGKPVMMRYHFDNCKLKV